MKSKYTGLVIAAVCAALLGAGTWYVNAIYLPRAQIRKAQELQTTAAEKEKPGTDYDYTIPVDESAIKLEEPEDPHANEDTAAGGQEPSDAQEPSEASSEQPTDIYITRDWHEGGESHVSTTPPVIEEPKPSTAVPAQQPTQSKPSSRPAQAEPKPEPEPAPEPEPEPEPSEPKDTDTLADLLPQRGETRVVNGQTLVWYDGWGWIPESASQQIEDGELNEAIGEETGNSEAQQEQQTEEQG